MITTPTNDHTHSRYYSTQIFCSIHIESFIATAIVGTMNFLTTLLTIFLVDKVTTWLP